MIREEIETVHGAVFYIVQYSNRFHMYSYEIQILYHVRFGLSVLSNIYFLNSKIEQHIMKHI